VVTTSSWHRIAATTLLLTALAALGSAAPAEALNADYWRGGWRTPFGEAPHIYYFVIRGDQVTGVYCRNCSDATTIGFIDGSWDEQTGIAFTVTVPNPDGSVKSVGRQHAMLVEGRLSVTGGAPGSGGKALTLIKDPRRPDPGGRPAYYLPPGTPTVYPAARPAGAAAGAPAPRAPYWQPGPFKKLREADIAGTWIAASFGPLGMDKQIFTFLRVGDRLRGVVCGRCDNACTLAALERVTIVGDTLYFQIAHQDRGNIDPPVFDRSIMAQVVQNEMIASVLGYNIAIDPARPPARRTDAAPFTLVGPIAADATKGNGSEGVDIWGPGTGAAIQPPSTNAPSR
jgi:hypothetical protein